METDGNRERSRKWQKKSLSHRKQRKGRQKKRKGRQNERLGRFMWSTVLILPSKLIL